MRKTILLSAVLLSMLVIFTACNRKEIERLRRERDSLANLTNEKQDKIDEYLSYFNEIQQNLNIIKQKENILTKQLADSSEMTASMKDQINNDILTIYQLMTENKQQLEKLKKQIRASGTKNKKLEETIALYEQQLNIKDQEIAALKQKLEQMNFDMAQLNQKIDEMTQRVSQLEDVQNKQQQVISQQEEQLNTVYYVIGTKNELKNKQILNRDGFLAKLSVDANFDKSNFVKIDKRQVLEISINAKNIDIMTKHPSTSFTLKKNDKVIEKLLITNADEFWSISKFLVIMVK